MSEKFKLTRDHAGEISYGLYAGRMKRVSALLGPETYAYYEIQDEDKYIFFFPSGNANYMISETVPSAPILVVDDEFQSQGGFINIAHIGLEGWPADPTTNYQSKRIYVWALDVAMWMTLGISE
jgi:hypothetical protein